MATRKRAHGPTVSRAAGNCCGCLWSWGWPGCKCASMVVLRLLLLLANVQPAEAAGHGLLAATPTDRLRRRLLANARWPVLWRRLLANRTPLGMRREVHAPGRGVRLPAKLLLVAAGEVHLRPLATRLLLAKLAGPRPWDDHGERGDPGLAGEGTSWLAIEGGGGSFDSQPPPLPARAERARALPFSGGCSNDRSMSQSRAWVGSWSTSYGAPPEQTPQT